MEFAIEWREIGGQECPPSGMAGCQTIVNPIKIMGVITSAGSKIDEIVQFPNLAWIVGR